MPPSVRSVNGAYLPESHRPLGTAAPSGYMVPGRGPVSPSSPGHVSPKHAGHAPSNTLMARAGLSRETRAAQPTAPNPLRQDRIIRGGGTVDARRGDTTRGSSPNIGITTARMSPKLSPREVPQATDKVSTVVAGRAERAARSPPPPSSASRAPVPPHRVSLSTWNTPPAASALSAAHSEAELAQRTKDLEELRASEGRLREQLEAEQGARREKDRQIEELQAELARMKASDSELRLTIERHETAASLREQEVAREVQVAESGSPPLAVSSKELVSKDSRTPALSRPPPSRHSSSIPPEELFGAAATNDVPSLQAALVREGAAEEVLSNRDADGRTLLHVSLAAGCTEAAKFLLEAGQKWSTRQKYVHNLQGELLERGVERFINGQDGTGQSPLSLLCYNATSTPEVAMLLLQAQADPVQRDLQGMTPFIISAKTGNTSMMNMFLQATRGMVLCDTDDMGRSALHWAAKEGQAKPVEMLVKAGADVEMVDSEGRDAAQEAREHGHEAVLEVLTQASQMSQEPNTDEGDEREVESVSDEGAEGDDSGEGEFVL